jgi:branched-chain amino acid transport system ATP-binding protein
MTVLVAQDIVAGYGRLKVVHGVSVSCSAGEVTSLIGPNGAGKSTLLKAIAGLVPVTDGQVLLDGAPVDALAAERRVRTGLVFVPQNEDLFTELTVAENIEMRAYLHRPKRSHTRAFVRDALIPYPDLVPKIRDKASTLSGGQRKMLSIAGAMAAKPKVLMLDEPTAGLAPRYAAQIWECVRTIAADGIAVLVVEQNVAGALANSQTVCVLVGGTLALYGPSRFVAEQDLPGIFLGKSNSTIG